MGVGLRPGAKAPEEPPTPYRLRAPPRLYPPPANDPLSAATRKALSARAGAVELTPATYLEFLFANSDSAAVLDDLVDRAVIARVRARRLAAKQESAPVPAKVPATGQPPRPSAGGGG